MSTLSNSHYSSIQLGTTSHQLTIPRWSLKKYKYATTARFLVKTCKFLITQCGIPSMEDTGWTSLANYVLKLINHMYDNCFHLSKKSFLCASWCLSWNLHSKFLIQLFILNNFYFKYFLMWPNFFLTSLQPFLVHWRKIFKNHFW